MRRKDSKKASMLRDGGEGGSGIQVATIVGHNKVQGMIIGGCDWSEMEVNFVEMETDEDLWR